ncbi:flagellar filament capping protein FliD [Candidatus Nucleicultrix amoebiphila]|uniref:Flagellar hook-associated protein 2 n=1 Tax=Candidatus Nucleicultrix amoebiphila FS5 TaxID=1414854 RepID=A0A1W6N2I3_9PROT|nr:flagellar filament capping protein FliD [Candidatus Nucleicultrix amoebiphila]ARN84025.1 hypothetical protein GQ61_00150 [Candidatus Nucleicultrix amoebiphila FS5]
MSLQLGIGSPLTFNGADVDENGRISLQSTVMGLDVKKTVDDVKAALEKQLDTPKKTIETIDSKLKALSTLQTKVTTLRDALDNLRGPAEGLTSAGIFNKLGYLVPNATYSGAVTLSLDDTASPQNFNLNITQLATQDVVIAGGQIADITTDMGLTGNLTFQTTTYDSNGLPVYGTLQVTLDGQSAQQIADTIKMNQSLTGITATLTQAVSGNYQFAFKELNYGTPLTFTKNVTGGTANLVPDSSVATADSLSAKYTVDGIAAKASSNTFNIFPGVNITLNQVTNATFQVQLMPDVVSIKQAIVDFTNAYNDVYDEIKKQSALNEAGDKKADDAFLFGNRILNSLKNVLAPTLASSLDGAKNTSIITLADIGITMGSATVVTDASTGVQSKVYDGRLVIDNGILNNALNTNVTGVQKLFGFTYQTTDSTFSVTQHPESLPTELANNTWHVSLAKDNSGTLSAVFWYDNDPSSIQYAATIETFSTKTAIVSGPVGSVFANIEVMIQNIDQISNNSSRQTSINSTQGQPNKLKFALDGLLDPTSGVGDFATQQSLFTDQKTQQETKITQIQKQIDLKRDALLQSMQEMQMAVNAALTMQNTLTSLLYPGAASAA